MEEEGDKINKASLAERLDALSMENELIPLSSLRPEHIGRFLVVPDTLSVSDRWCHYCVNSNWAEPSILDPGSILLISNIVITEDKWLNIEFLFDSKKYIRSEDIYNRKYQSRASYILLP